MRSRGSNTLCSQHHVTHQVARELEDPFIHPPNEAPLVAVQRSFNARLLCGWGLLTASYALPATHHSLLTAHHSLLTAHYSTLPTPDSLLTTRHSPLITDGTPSTVPTPPSACPMVWRAWGCALSLPRE